MNKGSMVSIVQAIQQQRCSETDDSAPGVVLANTGELFWWPEGKKALSPRMRHSVPMRSAVHLGVYYDREVNAVPGNETTLDHVRYVFENVAGKMVEKGAKVDVIGCGDGAEAVEKFLDANWDAWGARLGSFAILGGYLSVYGLKSEGFKNFLKEVRYPCSSSSNICLQTRGRLYTDGGEPYRKPAPTSTAPSPSTPPSPAPAATTRPSCSPNTAVPSSVPARPT